MNEAPEDLHHRLDQLRLLATETTDPLAERLVRDLIAELEANPAPGTDAALAEAQSLRDDLEIQLAQSQADLEAGLPSVLNTASAETARIVPSSRRSCRPRAGRSLNTPS